jgi:hypothetical protein
VAAVIGGAALALVVALVARDGDRGEAPAPPPPGETATSPFPPPGPPLPTAPPPLPPAGAAPSGDEIEDALIERLRAAVDEDPAGALELAREIERRHPDGDRSDEREWLEMRALVHLGDIAAARDAAEEFFERHPESPFAPDVHRLTGVRPRPIPPIER